MKGLTKIIRLAMICCLMLMGTVSAMAQSATKIRGSVIDTSGEGLPGASVRVKGGTEGTATDFDGKFELQCAPGTLLEVTYIGYVAQEVPAADGMVITLVEDSEMLNEVVVIGYGTVKKSDATGSLATLEADPKLKGVASTADDMLVGKIAGVTVTSGGGSATGGSSIRIRGGSSLSASNDPLIILDGVYLDNSGIGGVGNMLSTIDPNDIESFTVLKDASATAIYGSRASNGVILITTKKGKSGRVKITYDGTVSISHIKKKINVLDGNEFQDLIKNTFAGASNQNEVYTKLGLAMNPETGEWESVSNANTDWQKEIFRTAISTEHNISALGSIGEFMPYRISLGYTNNNGILKTDHMRRYTGSIALTPSFFNGHLKASLFGKAMHIKSNFANGGAVGAAIFMDPTKPVYDDNSPYHGYWSWVGDDGNLISVATKNPVSILECWDDQAKVWNFIGSAQLEYNAFFVPGLKANLNLSIDASSSKGYSEAPFDAPSFANSLGFRNDWTNHRTNKQLDFYATYARDLESIKSHFDIMAGYSWQHYFVRNDWYTVGQHERDVDGNLVPKETSISQGESKTEHYILSFFGRVNYSYDNRYLATFTLRDDGSSRFAKKNRWGLFPSLALAWRISEEAFMKEQNTLSNLKLRLGWGKTGQQDINQGDYPYLGSYSYSINNAASYYRDGEWSRLLKPNAYNEDLKWETTTTWNAGIDFGFLDNRINGSLDFYHRKTTDLINAEAKVPAGVNFAEYVVANIGSLTNTGLELTMNFVPIRTNDVTWEINTNVAWNKNKIIELTNGDNSAEIRRFGRTSSGDGSFQLKAHAVDQPAGMFYVYEQVYDSDGHPLEGVFVDRNDDGIVDENDLYFYHNADPSVTYGFSTKLQYKNWDFSVAGHGQGGNWIYNSVASNSAELSRARLFANAFLSNRTDYAFDTNWQTSKVLSDYYVQNGAFFRIDNITLGYSFENLFASRLGGRVYATVQNPFVFTKYKGLDPEISGGFDDNFYPRPVTYMLGLSLNF